MPLNPSHIRVSDPSKISVTADLTNPFLSIIVPVCNEEGVLEEFYRRTREAIPSSRFEIIFIDDGSRDHSWKIIQHLAKEDPHVAGLSFSRNFGHQAALSAGLNHARGDVIITIDSDLQDPPEMIPQMLEKWREGYEVIYGVRTERKGETLFKRLTAFIFYRLFSRISKVGGSLDAGDFRLLSRNVVDVLNQTPERIRFMRGLIHWTGFKQTSVPYSRDPRFAGETKYPFFKMLKFAFDGLTSFSSLPLQLASYLGFFVTAFAFVIAAYSLYVRFFDPSAVRGWTSILIVIIFLGGIQLLMIGVIGEYIARIYEEVKHRPLYVLREKIGSSE